MSDRPVTDIKGIGKVKKNALAKLGIYTIQELLYHFPRDYEDRRRITKISDLRPGMQAQIKATVLSAEDGEQVKYAGRKLLRIMVSDDSGTMEIVFFNSDYLYSKFIATQEYIFYGKTYPGKAGMLQMTHPDYRRSDEISHFDFRVLPIYPLTAGVSQKDLRKWIDYCLNPDLRDKSTGGSCSDFGYRSNDNLNVHLDTRSCGHSDTLCIRSDTRSSVYSDTHSDARFNADSDSPDVHSEAQTFAHSISHSNVHSNTPSPVYFPDEFLPEKTVINNNLCGIDYALKNIHFPEDRRKLQEAKYRLIFEELLVLQTGLLLVKHGKREETGITFDPTVNLDSFIRSIPFKLTKAQSNALAEIISDMEKAYVMNRLLQGDVGSGKTVVAAAAMYKAVKCGYQAVIMSPTETLARQHYSELTKILEPHAIKTSFLSGSVRGLQRTAMLEAIKIGDVQVLTGTHALIQEDVIYHNLGLVITDEQHRFGVNQRISLVKKGNSPDTLVMTATPIPRTLAFILYGDLDVSIIDEMPPGRRQVITNSLSRRNKNKAYDLISREIENGHQAYVVTPLIEETEESELNSAKKIYRELSSRFKEHKVALLHGQMKYTEKDAVMSAFYAHDIDVLVSTVLIEVGINVPNATVMLVENAERFGLAQLHQLRGRVGRGDFQSYCLLINEGNTDESKERIKVMCSTNDGFEIAEKDLRLRGPGEFFGTMQHGIPYLRIADLAKHVKVLKAVRDEAVRIIEDDPQLVKLQNRGLREKTELFFNHTEEIGL